MTAIFSTHELHPDITQALEKIGDYQVASQPVAEAILAEGRDAEILIVRAPIPPEYFNLAPKLRAAIRHGAGLDMIPVAAATKAGVLVANVPGANARTVAEHVLFVSIALLRGFRMMDRDLRQSGWNAGRHHAGQANELTGRTIGIVGFGNIGREVFQLFGNGFQLPVIAHTRSPGKLPASVRPVDIDQLMETSDIIVLCCPLNDQTRSMLNAKRIGRMKPDALIINVSRGPVIEEKAIIAALQNQQIGGAALDVFDEQPLPLSHPFFELENVIITPHMAGVTVESMLRMGTVVVEETARIINGELPLNFCNRDVSEKYRKRFNDQPS